MIFKVARSCQMLNLQRSLNEEANHFQKILQVLDPTIFFSFLDMSFSLTPYLGFTMALSTKGKVHTIANNGTRRRSCFLH